MPITMLNGFGCSDYGCSCAGFGDIGELYHVGDTVLARKTLRTFVEPRLDSKALRTIKPNGYVGKIAEGRAAGWLRLTTGAWFINNPENIYKVQLDPSKLVPLTNAQKIDLLKVIAQGNPVTAGQVPVIEAAINTVQGAGELVEGTFNTIGFIGKNMKWIVVAALAVAGYIGYKEFKKLTT